MAALRSLAFNILFFLWTAAVVVIGMPALIFGPPGVYFMGRLWSRGTFWLLKHLIGLTHRLLGRERLPGEPVIAAVKHQSSWDTMICTLLFKEPAFVLKRELTWIPFFGWFLLRGGMIPVDRAAGGAALRRLLRRAKQAAADGRSVVIYPEGTRTAPGTSRPYQPGVAALYEHLSLPVVPVALNSGLFWGRRSFLKLPGTITLEILEPIAPGLGRRPFIEELERRLEGASLRLAAAAPEPPHPSERG
ncbi:MAG: 1-acyl-sn-glycerol-3-phosphate acyltransferase [Rhodospirillales bacterium]|nr:1-acyl-sn-glycerol-3-phosphate acyltransferase [Rhodospirillales bacterium]